jgi:hypothetical protein
MITTALLASLLAAYQGGEARNLKAYIDKLGSDAPMTSKQEAGDALVKAGKSAIPVLIASLQDTRVYETRDVSNRMNLPPNAQPPKPLMAKITVGERCEKLLYRIITPATSSPFAGNFKVISEQILRITDWNQWWAANQAKSLDAIHVELQPLVDQYWKQHGITQTVPIRKADRPGNPG